MQDAQTIYDRIQDTKKKIKKKKKELKEIYLKDPEYARVVEQLRPILEKRKQEKVRIDEANFELVMKIKDLQIDLDSDRELLNDIVLSKVMKGEKVEIIDEYKQPQLPIFTIKFSSEEYAQK